MKLNIRTHLHFVFGRRMSLDFTFFSKYPSHCSRQHVLQHGFTQWLPPPSFTFMAADIYSNICWKSHLSTLYHVIFYVSMIFFSLDSLVHVYDNGVSYVFLIIFYNTYIVLKIFINLLSSLKTPKIKTSVGIL